MKKGLIALYLKIKENLSIKKLILTGIVSIVVIAMVLAGRLLYVMFQNPMAAFKTPETQKTITPVPLKTPMPQATASPTPDAAKPAKTEQIPSPTPHNSENVDDEIQNIDETDFSYMENRVNILLLGYDKSPERTDEENELFRDETNDFRSDTLILLSVDFEKGKAYLISVPRDTYAPIYRDDGKLYSEKGRWKINAAFAKGGSGTSRGFGFAMETVSRLLGVPIDYYAGVDMSGLKGVVNAMGGLYYDVDIEIRLNGRTLKTGYQKLNGQQVLDYCRARKGISTDAGRTNRQQKILLAIFDQLKQKDQLLNFPALYKSMKKHIKTNMNVEQIGAIAAFGAKLNKDDITMFTLDGEYRENTPYSGASYYLIDNEKMREKMKDIFGINIKTNPRYDLYYVLGDIEAATGKKDLEKAKYLLNHSLVKEKYGYDEELGFTNPFAPLKALEFAIEELNLALIRKDDNMDIPLNHEEIAKCILSLHTRMKAVCFDCGITKKDVSSSRLPKDVYAGLA